MSRLGNIKAESWVKAAVYGLLLFGVFYSSHRVMIGWWENEDYNYCYLIAPIVLYLIWEKREELAQVPARSSWRGAVPLGIGIFLFWLGELAGEFTTMYFASWFVLVGLLWMHLGWEKLKVIWFPILFIIAMFPPPNFFHFNLTLQLKLISSQIGVSMMQAYGLSAYREGNIIDLGFTKLQVVDACSGLRYLYPLIIMAILLAYFYRGVLWKKVLLVVSAVPLTIITNSLRIAMTGILYEIWGPQVAEDFFHGFSGWFIFMFGMAVLLLEMWALNGFSGLGLLGGFGGLKDKTTSVEDGLASAPGRSCQPPHAPGCCSSATPEALSAAGDASSAAPIEPPAAAVKESAPQAQSSPTASDLKLNTSNLTRPEPRGLKALFSPPQFVAAVVLLAGTLALAQGIEFREKIPPAQDFASFPLELGDWTGRREVMGQEFVDQLTFSDYIIVDYANGSKAVNFYTAYYESQRKGESIHSPETCLPGGGWEFRNAGKVVVELDGEPGSGSTGQRAHGSTITVNRAFMEKGATKQLSYFWFPSRDRVLTNAWEMKWYNFWDALTRQRTDGALVRLITPLYPNESMADADRRLVEFTRAVVPVLNEYLPK
jgi:EpsI family protein